MMKIPVRTNPKYFLWAVLQEEKTIFLIFYGFISPKGEEGRAVAILGT